MKTLDIEIRKNGDTALVKLTGEFDLAGVRDFHRTMSELQALAPAQVCIDLSEVTFMAASGLRALLDLQGRCRTDHFELVVVKGPALVQRVFEMTGVDRRLTLIDR